MAYGYRAAWKILESYWKHFHSTGQCFNVTTIIGRWAPPTENDTQAYIRTVLKLSGLGGQENLPQPSRGTFTAREAARSNDYGGVWNTLQGSEHGKHPERIPPRLPGQEKVCPDKAGRGGVHQPGGLAHLG